MIRVERADSRELLPTPAGVDAVVTDQPYGTGWVRGGKSVGVFAASGACRRIEEAQRQGDMFRPVPERKPEQLSILEAER